MGRYSNPDIVSRLQRILADHARDLPSHRSVRSPRQKQTRLSDSQRSEIIERYWAGESVNALASAFGVHRTTIVRHFDDAGVSTRYRILSEADVAKAAILYEQGWSLTRVGEHFGIAARTVQNAFRAAGIPTRPPGTNQWS